MRTSLTIALLAAAAASATAQTANLAAYYSFDDGTPLESRGLTEFDGFVNGNPEPACGVEGGSILFDGVGDYLVFAGPINDRFKRSDFAVSFYFHATGVSPRQTLLRKADDCDDENQRFTIDYLANEGALEINFAEGPAAGLGGPSQLIPLDLSRCWHHLVVERNERELRVYLDGERVRRLQSSTRLNISNGFNLEIARAACPTTSSNFQGFIDELYIYQGSITLDEIEALYLAPDRIAEVAFPVINVGADVDLRVERTCANSFSWSPVASITDGLNTVAVTVAPERSTVYAVELGYPNSGCRSADSVLIQVFDPEEFDCTQLLVPSAFTPNGSGPEQNDRLGISNAATLQTFESFEVYDRWGNQVFATATATDTWDGTYEGEPAMPGVYLWRVAFGCNDEDLDETGSVVLIR